MLYSFKMLGLSNVMDLWNSGGLPREINETLKTLKPLCRRNLLVECPGEKTFKRTRRQNSHLQRIPQ